MAFQRLKTSMAFQKEETDKDNIMPVLINDMINRDQFSMAAVAI